MWQFCGYNEIQDPPSRYRIIDLDCLVKLMGFSDLNNFQSAHKRWIESSLKMDKPERENHWSQSIAVGGKSFVKEVKKSLGFKVKGRSVTGGKGDYQLREDVANFGNASLFESEPVSVSGPDTINTFLWEEKL